MKSFIKLIPFVTLILSIAMTSCKQKSEEPDLVVTLRVDTDNIKSGASEKELESYCKFEKQKPGQSLKDYLIEINLGEIIEWKGISENGDDEVHITKIKYKGGTNAFPDEETELLPAAANKKTIKVKPVKRTEGNDCEYILHFKIISDNGNANGNFIIDPFMRVK